LVARFAGALGIEANAARSLTEVIGLAADTADQPVRRDCAVLLVHALAVPTLVPPAAADLVCRLAESGLRGALLRSGYPFGGSPEDRMRALERLHSRIGELLQPLEPTFSQLDTGAARGLAWVHLHR
jgi:hypothetical protein